MANYLSPGVYTEEVSSGSKPIEGVGTAVAAFVGFAERGPTDEPVLVTNWTQFSQAFGGFLDDGYLAHAVYGYFLNGGGAAYVVRVGGGTGDGTATARAEIAGVGSGRPVVVRAVEAGPAGNDVSIEVQDSSEPGDDAVKLVVRKGDVEEVYDNVTVRRGPSHVVTALRQSKLVAVEDVKGQSAVALPSKGTRTVLSGGEVAAVGPVRASDYVGDSGDRTGFAGLEAVDDVTMLCVPDLMSAYQRGAIDRDGVKAVQLAMIAHCELMSDRVAILDPLPDLKPQALRTWRVDEAGYDSKYATLYWPWLDVVAPNGKKLAVPPSGHVAGVWARNDDTRGVHKAPANEVVRGVVGLRSGLTRGEHDTLNPVGVNCVRSFPGQGVRIWGARTLSSDPEWRYLNVRRLFNYVEKSILNGTNWVVFEPNDQYLWGSVNRTINMFLRRVWRSGALFGSTPDQAFYVKCDAENNPEENRDAGILTVDIGIAPVKPAEFVVFRLAQYSEGAALQE
ncbi:phage tail sheath family protein [Umezawaea endophytica]|uniref:Phage tail sheath subtilisin-like domain-containing protein n=1 Tax=Umezawaea endophytica TaxID=1654476 RepID=A0A9X2VIP3_9PSEU|nr:phage tail sheath subtilisin-like domain-containing protein [Umezawaea endophytica]MCS7477109.1 phage tail sheath subtilisin-like domain-containing protein [Umezawaea endophytica]